MKAAAFVLLALLAIGALAFLWLWTPDLARAELEARYRRAPSDTIDLDGLRLHLRDEGPASAPAVVLLHGLGSSLHTWEPWARRLAGSYRIVRFDLPGSGLSPPDPSGIYDDRRATALLLALLDRLGLERASLVGNSVGGRIAWRFAAQHPGRVEKLVLVSPDGFASPGFAYGKAGEVSPTMELMRWLLPRPLLRSTLAQSYGDPSRLSEDAVTRTHDLLRAPGARAALLARLRQTVLVEPEPLLREIRVPVLLLWGEKDALIPVANAADYLRALPDARLVTFPTLGHVPQEEAPDESIEPLLAFLAE